MYHYKAKIVFFLLCFLIPLSFFSWLQLGGWIAAVVMTLPEMIAAAVLGYFVCKEHASLRKGECYSGTVIACWQQTFSNNCILEAEFFIDGERYTTAQYVRGNDPADFLASTDCVICCYTEKGVPRCVIRGLQYNKKWYAKGCRLPEKSYDTLYPMLGLACTGASREKRLL